jgi:Core-2/I-Branching enzyme
MTARLPVCFLLLTHRSPEQVKRLVGVVAPCPVLVHLDAHAGRQVWAEFQELAEECGQLDLVERTATGWGSWGLVQATLNGLERALDLDCTHIVKMTGQDYPIRPIEEIAAFCKQSPATSWIPHDEIPVSFLGEKDGGVARTKHWHMAVRGHAVSVPMNRRPPEGITPFYGQAQLVMSMPLARWLVAEVRRRPELVRFFRRTWMPNELFIPSLAMTSPMAADVSGSNLWFTDWSAGGSHPKVFGREDIDELMAAALGHAGDLPGGKTKFFARKFDLQVDTDVLNLIDERLLAPHGTRTELR